MIKKIAVTVAAVIEQNHRFLLVEERSNEHIVFNQPAGHLEPGETLLEAITREVSEETGFSFQPVALLGFYLWNNKEANTTFLRLAFVGDAYPPNTTPILDEEIITTHWLRRKDILAKQSQLRSPLVLRCINDYLDGIRYPLSILKYL